MSKETVVTVLEKARLGDLTSESTLIAKKILSIHRGRGPHFFVTASLSEKSKLLADHADF